MQASPLHALVGLIWNNKMYRWPLYHSYRLVVPVVVWCCSDINTQSHWWHKIARAQRKFHPETAQGSNYLRNRQIRIANMERCLKYLLCDCVWGTKANRQTVHGLVSPGRGELAALIMMYAIWKTWTTKKVQSYSKTLSKEQRILALFIWLMGSSVLLLFTLVIKRKRKTSFFKCYL